MLVFAGNHGVTRQGVSAYPAEVTVQMVANFAAGGAAINQLARTAGASLRVIPLSLDPPTADFTESPPLTEADFLAAVRAGYEAVSPQADLVCLGEMGIGNTTAAAAIAAALFGGGGARWAGRGTGVDDDGPRASAPSSTARSTATPRSSTIRSASPRRSAAASLPPFSALRLRRGATTFRSCSTASSAPPRWRRSTSSAPIRWRMRSPATSPPRPATACCSTSSSLKPLVDLNMRLGEASGAAVAVLILRAALACHTGMATFAEAGVSDKPADESGGAEGGGVGGLSLSLSPCGRGR